MPYIVTKKQFLETYKCKNAAKLVLNKNNYDLPLKPTICLAKIVADLMGDGHIQDHPHGIITFTSKNKEEIIDFEKRFAYLFGKKGNISSSGTNRYGKSYNYRICSKPLTRILKLCGVPSGSKVRKKFDIPNWIFRKNIFLMSFCKNTFDCEGSIRLQDNKRIIIKLSLYKAKDLEGDLRNYLNKLRNILFKFGIKSTNLSFEKEYICKDRISVIGLGFEIHGTKNNMKNIINFKEKIGFDNKTKIERLNKYISLLTNI